MTNPLMTSIDDDEEHEEHEDEAPPPSSSSAFADAFASLDKQAQTAFWRTLTPHQRDQAMRGEEPRLTQEQQDRLGAQLDQGDEEAAPLHGRPWNSEGVGGASNVLIDDFLGWDVDTQQRFLKEHPVEFERLKRGQ